ncbi:20556_t:CDS:2, partial [Gigaspora rosea]
INGRSVLLELKSIKFFDSFPVDIMYSLFKNIAPAILRHWSGLFFKDNQLSNSEYTIPNSVWTNIRKIVLYSILLLQGILPKRHLNGWAKFVHAVKLCLKRKIDTAELLEINQLFCEFVTHYEKEYLQNNPLRLPAALISYHYLLHIASSICNTGPA